MVESELIGKGQTETTKRTNSGDSTAGVMGDVLDDDDAAEDVVVVDIDGNDAVAMCLVITFVLSRRFG